MRTSRIAVTLCSGLLGLGALVTQAVPAQAGPIPPMVLDQSGDSIKVGPGGFVTPTTKPGPKPADLVPLDGLDLKAPDAAPTDHAPADEPAAPASAPTDPDCNPLTPSCDPDDCVPVPGGPDCPPEECVPDSTVPGTPEEQCPPDEDPCRPTSGATAAQVDPRPECCPTEPVVLQVDAPGGHDDRCDEPECPEPGDVARSQGQRPEHCCPQTDDDPIARSAQDPCDPCVPEQTDRPILRHHDDAQRDDCLETGTDGGDGRTDGGGRLPKTGGDLVTYGVVGLGLTGLGAALKRIGRRKEA